MRRILKFLARMYPAEWRARYGAEYEALLEEGTPQLRDVVDVCWGAFTMQMTSWTFIRILLVCSLTGAVAAVAISFIPSKKYVSQVLVSVDSPGRRSIDNELAGRTQDLISSPFLISVIQKENLYTSERSRMPMDDVVGLMRKGIYIRSLQTKDGKRAPAFELDFVYTDPHVAQRVADVLVSRLTALNLQAAIDNPSASSRSPMTLRIDDPANLPQTPVFPKRGLFGAGGLCAGLIGGLIVALVFSRCGSTVAIRP